MTPEREAYYDPNESPCFKCYEVNVCVEKTDKETCISWLRWQREQRKKEKEILQEVMKE